MPGPAWETAHSSVNGIDHRGSSWKEIPVREEIAVTLWQQVHTQSPSDEDDSFPEPVACDVPEGWPQQSWAADAVPPASKAPTTIRKTSPFFMDGPRVMAGRLCQIFETASTRIRRIRCPGRIRSARSAR